MTSRSPLLLVLIAGLALCVACGGGSMTPPPPATYTISSTVTGLTGTLVLQDDGGDNLSITSNGTFSFATKISSGGSYNVTILTQPSGQTCTLGSNSTGTASANVMVSVTCIATLYTITASVSGLSGTLVLQDNGGDNLSITASGTFNFATKIANGKAYAVTVLTPPSGQTCTLGSNSSGMATANVTVNVTCAATMYTISAAVSGLTGGTLVLQDILQGNADNLSISSNGTFNFATKIAYGGTYNVVGATQPQGQTCTLGSNSTGTATSNVTVTVTCTAVLYTIYATVSGLTNGPGALVLQDNNSDNLTITNIGTFPFKTQIASGSTYNVTIQTQPIGQTCTLGSNSSGTATSSVTVTVTCSVAMYTISAAVSGLTGGTLVLQDALPGNGVDNLSITSNGTFNFATQIAYGNKYAVTVFSEPTGQTCSIVGNNQGTVTSPVTVNVTCAPTLWTISASVTGLTSGTLVLLDNGIDNLNITTNGIFNFPTQIANGSAYKVTIQTQPTGLTCTLGSNSSGTATSNVSVSVTCAPALYTISVLVSGLSSGTLVLQDNGKDNLSISSNGTFNFATQIASGGSYSVTVFTQPTGQTCTLGSNSSGTVTANVTVNVTCVPLYTISAAVSGLNSGTSLVLQDNGGDNLTITANGTFPFKTQIASGGSYSVTVFTQPSSETCTLGSNSSGTATSNVTVNVTCVPLYTISAKVSGFTSGTLVLQDNGGDNLSISSDGTFNFATQIVSGGSYDVTIFTQPSGGTCTLGSNSSGIATSNVTVNVTCTAATYTIGGTVYGLSGTGAVLQDNLTNNLSITANGPFTFTKSINSGSTYSVTVLTQPKGPAQSCAVNNGSGTATANVTNVQVVCTSEWTWVSGSNLTGQNGDYGTLRVTAPTNIPGARYGAVTWIDSSGNLWLFGGFGNDVNGIEDYLNDLWEFSNGEWTWMSGSNASGAPPTYGTLGVAAPTNVPGSRAFSVGWKDLSGNFWLFGGYGVDVNNIAAGVMNDLWKWDGTNWTWEGGSQTMGQGGSYGIQGQGSPTNIPGARTWASGFTDASGNFWMFGGNGIDSLNNSGNLNDLWEFSGGDWIWVSGSTLVNQQGTYGVLGQTGTGNVPGARLGSSVWIDASGNFWLFGGNGIDSVNTSGYLNDVWEFTGGNWIWQAGAEIVDQAGNYGTQGIAAAGNTPGGRVWSTSWLTPKGELWIHGGQRLSGGEYNDLWMFSGGQWTWIAGSQSVDVLGVYATHGSASPNNVPGSRQLGLTWTDAKGNLWMMGGFGFASKAGLDDLNDLWEFQP